MKRSFLSYPHRWGLKSPDRNIDHRRVRTILPYFERHWHELSADVGSSAQPLLPGDVVFLDTLPGPAADHIGIVSDRVGPSGLPLLINNWTDGHQTAEMDLLGWVPATHRFRVPLGALPWAPEHTGLSGLLGRRGLRVAAGQDQVVLAVAPLMSIPSRFHW